MHINNIYKAAKDSFNTLLGAGFVLIFTNSFQSIMVSLKANLEDLQHAKKRGANIIAEVIGFSMSSDASDLIVPNVDGPERAIREALKDAKINTERVTYINAHGTGTVLNDKIECQAIKNVFLDQSSDLKVSCHPGFGCSSGKKGSISI